MFSAPGEIIAAASRLKALGAKSLRPESQRLQIRLVGRIELGPATSMLFRPEEIHARSAVSPAFRRPAKAAIGIAHYRLRFNQSDCLIVHLHHDRLAAIGARSVHPYRLSWK